MIKLSELEREIIKCSQLQADTSIASLARELKRKESTVRDSLKGLVGRGIIRKVPLLNFSPLGLKEHYIFLSLEPVGLEKVNMLHNLMIGSGRVPWMLRLGGKYDYVLLTISTSNEDLSMFFEQLSERLGNIFKLTSISLICSRTFFSRKYLCSKQIGPQKITLPELKGEYMLDELDHLILEKVGNFPDLPNSIAARQLRIPESTLAYRLEALKKKNVIAGWIYSAPQIIDGVQRFRIHIKLKSSSSEAIIRIQEYCLQAKFILTCHRIIGEFDLILEVEVTQISDFGVVMGDIRSSFGDLISHIEPSPVLGTIKVSTYPIRSFQLKLKEVLDNTTQFKKVV